MTTQPTTQPPAAGEAAHTPGPWHVSDTRLTAALCSADGIHVSTIEGYGNKHETNVANAVFIVRACNAHASLLARVAELEGALREIADAAQSAYERADRDTRADLHGIESQARAALAQTPKE